MTRLMTPLSNGEPMVGNRIHRMVDDLFNDFFNSRWPTGRVDLGHTDIYETDGTLQVETALPGVRREDIQVRLEEGQLIIRGAYTREQQIPEENVLYSGRPSGKFQKAFPLPEQVVQDAERIEAVFEDGILKVSLPLSESVTNKGVEIDVQ